MRLSKAGVAMLMRGPTDRVCFMVRGGGWRPLWCGGVRRRGGEARPVQRKEKGKEKGAWVKGEKIQNSNFYLISRFRKIDYRESSGRNNWEKFAENCRKFRNARM
jgi:hypothetical protein